jgi:uncharacterized YccA/Bax inhibitor family protein
MQSKNPVFTRAGFQHTQTPSAEQLHHMYGAPSYTPPEQTREATMTYDDVVARTAMSLGVVVIFAAIGWNLAPSLGGLLFGAPILGFIVGIVIAMKHVTNPVAILGYSALQGVFVGAFSRFADALVTQWTGSGVVVPAVLGTLGAAGATLAVYAFRIVRVTPKFTRFVIAATAGFIVVSLLNLVLSFFGADFGWRGLGTLGLIASAIGILLACFMLMLDFNFIEEGVNTGAPQKESWFAAFGLTMTLVWLYIEMVRLMTILSQSD